jgi:putative transposase
LFRTIAQMREIANTASKTTKRMRRDTERRHAVTTRHSTPTPLLPPEAPAQQEPDTIADTAPVPRFDQIEQW